MSYLIPMKQDADAMADQFNHQHRLGCVVHDHGSGGVQGYIIRTKGGRSLWLNEEDRSNLLRAYRARTGR